MVTNSELQRVGLSGWRTGLANLLHKENRAWWGSRRWMVQGILWAVIVNGFAVMMMFFDSMGSDPVFMGLQALFAVASLSLAIGAIVLAQGAIIGERQMGETEWVLSKPVSRLAYVLSKLLAHGLGVLIILVGLQSAIGYGLLWLKTGEPFPVLPYLLGITGLAAHTLFYLTLTLMMGVLTANRNTLLGVSLGTLFAGAMIGPFLGMAVMFTPWSLNTIMPAAVLAAVQGVALPVPIWVPIGITAVLSVIFVVVALARFERLEF
jgi:ABC-2 type transport system permease protein